MMTQNKLVLAGYAKTKHTRRSVIAATIQRLASSGYLSLDNDETLNFLVSNIELIARYWVSETAVFSQDLSKEQQIRQYLSMICNLLLPYCSAKAKKEIKAFKESLR